MKQAAFSASVLIAAVMALRAVFRGRVPRRVQYALWGLVLLRLCLPFPLFESRFSVLGSMPEAGVTQREVYVFPLSRREAGAGEAGAALAGTDGQVPDHNSFGYSVLSGDGKTVTRYAGKMRVGQILTLLWQGGALLCGLWFLGVNLRFYRLLRRTRRPFEAPGCPLKVYLTDAVCSPCLFGLLRPAVYLTPQAAASPEALRWVLAHELAHYRHGDHLWAFARAACVAAYWWNPLVWAAALLSRSDSELACDEAVAGKLDQAERLAYGRTLLDMVPQRRRPGGIGRGSTCMTSGAREMEERIRTLARRPRTAALALALLLAAAAAAVGCTFSGAAAREAAYTPMRPGAGEEETPAVLPGADIAALLDRIVEEPSAASDVNHFIERHREEYDAILACGEEALQYLYGQFLQGGCTDLRGAVMERALRELLGGEDIKTAAANGQAFFDGFLQYNRRLLGQNSAGFMREHRPKGYLLLQMTGDIA